MATLLQSHARVGYEIAKHLSKNRGGRNRGRPFTTADTRAAREYLAAELQSLQKWCDDRLLVEILLVRPGAHGDAQNYVDAVCDVVEEVTGVDDRWYQVTADWMIDPESPGLEVSLTQWADGHKRWCAACGRMLPLEEFGKSKVGTRGRAGSCRECARNRQRERRSASASKQTKNTEEEIG